MTEIAAVKTDLAGLRTLAQQVAAAEIERLGVANYERLIEWARAIVVLTRLEAGRHETEVGHA